jgi:hypothetical protein
MASAKKEVLLRVAPCYTDQSLSRIKKNRQHTPYKVVNITCMGSEQLQKMNVTHSLMNTAYSISGILIVYEQHHFIMYYVKHGIFNKAEKNLNSNISSQAAELHTIPIPLQQFIMRAPLATTTHFSIDMNPQLQCTVQQTQQDQTEFASALVGDLEASNIDFHLKRKNRIG